MSKKAKRFYWCGYPAKLTMRDLFDEKGDHITLLYGDSVELTPAQQERYSQYIESGQFNTKLTEPPRRSKRTGFGGQKVPDRKGIEY